MHPKRRKRKRAKVLGDLQEGMLLTKEGCMRRGGIGHASLDAAVESGIVVPIEIAGRHFFESTELMQWIRRFGKRVEK